MPGVTLGAEDRSNVSLSSQDLSAGGRDELIATHQYLFTTMPNDTQQKNKTHDHTYQRRLAHSTAQKCSEGTWVKGDKVEREHPN
jgi:hypothetical protein